MGTLTKGLMGREDFNVQQNTNATESFNRASSTGGTVAIEKMPDIWDGLGHIHVAECKTSATDPGDITETVAAGDLTHDVLKAKINAILAFLRAVDFFA